MTDGTSQGLFIVVAIVIFGIFVALSYTVFGDTLSPGIQGMFSDATEQAMRKTMLRPNILDMNRVRGYNPYHTPVEIEGTTFTVELKDTYYKFVAIYDADGASKFLHGNVYTVSGYALRNGEPVKYSDWLSKRATSFQDAESFYVDDETGYFESTMTWVSSTHREYFLHNRLGNAQEGDVYTFIDIKVEEGDFATRR